MGRKPNQLVHEYFIRGRKLEDASNRYEHTCKRCGELFPKGRVDALLKHLLKRCPNVTQADRENIYFHLQTNPPPQPSIKGIKGLTKSSRAHTVGTQTEQQDATHVRDAQVSVDAVANAVQQLSALETLAEVSRQRLDFSTRRAHIDGLATDQDQSAREHDRILAEQALIFGFQQAANATDQSVLPATQDTNFYGDNTVPSIADPFASELPPPSPQHHVPINYESSYHHGPSQNPQSRPPYIMEHVLDPGLGTDAAHLPQQNRPQSPDAAWQTTAKDVMQWKPTYSSGRSTHTRDSLGASSNPLRTGFGLLQNGSKRSARARFSDDRRKEVQELRKQGACIRCRMLKKPCSDGTPCSTCANVTSARLWKGKCIRKRLAEEFTLWSTALFHARARSKLSASLVCRHENVMHGTMEASLFRNDHTWLCFEIKQCIPFEAACGVLPLTQQVMSPRAEPSWLLDEDECIGSKIEAYLHQNMGESLEHEPCHFMRATIQRTLELVHEEQTEQLAPAQDGKLPRSCYNLQQTRLLQNVLALWTATGFLTTIDQLPLELRYHAATEQHDEVVPVTWQSGGLIDHASPSYRLIKTQILAGLESCCSQLAKSVINELERRLLQRQQVSRLSTFIAAVILLGTVERMAYFFHESEDLLVRNYTADDAQMSSSAHTDSSESQLRDWPLYIQPSELWPQGEHFAHLLTMLLRMRALPPATRASDDGKLIVAQEYSLQSQAGDTPPKVSQMAEHARTAAQWLDPLGLDVMELKTKRDAREARARGVGGLEMWHMAFISLALLPET